MVNIIEKKLDIENEALKRFEMIGKFISCKPKIITGSIWSIDKTNISYIKPHRIIYNETSFLFFNFTNEVYIEDLNDDESTIFMVDSNMYREKLLPSEKAFSYKMKMDALKHQGKTSCHYDTKLRSDETLAEKSNDSARQIQRYIRLTYLIPELLEIVDNTSKIKEKHNLTMGLLPAVELSFLSKHEQQVVYSAITYEDTTPSHAQTIRIRKLSTKKFLTFDDIDKILLEEKGNQHEKISFNKSKIISVLPFSLAKRDKRYVEQYIIETIKLYKSINK